MKKSFYILLTTLLAVTACQQEELQVRKEITFLATSEQDTKTVLEGEKILWDSGDEIKVLWEGGAVKSVAKVGDNRSVAEFTAMVEESDSYYAVHPYVINSTLSDGRIVVVVPENQGGAFGDANITVAKADDNNEMAFMHLVGYVEFAVDKAGVVEFSGAENDILTGKVIAKEFDENGRPKYQTEKGTSKVSVNVTKPGIYYMAVLPDTELSGFTIRMKTSEATSSVTYSGKLAIGRGQLLPLGNITERLRREGQIESVNEKFYFDENVFDDDVDNVGICVPNSVSLDTDLSHLPDELPSLNLVVSSEAPITSIRLSSPVYLSGIIKENSVEGGYFVKQGSRSITINCSKQRQSSFTVPVRLLPSVNGEVSARICDVNGRMSETSFTLNLASGDTADQELIHRPSPDLIWFEGFDRCVWGGDVVLGQSGFSPEKGIPGLSVKGDELPLFCVSDKTAGSEMIHSEWHATLPVTGTSKMTPEYLSSRGFDGYRQLLRVHEYNGYIAVGTSVGYRGYVETLPLTNIGDLKSVNVRFRICPVPGCDETIRFEVANAGVITSVKVDGREMPNAFWHEKTVSRAVMSSDVIEIPVSDVDMRWQEVEVRVENVNQVSVLSWYPASSDQKVNGFYLDEICVEKAEGWDYDGSRDLRVLYWNIQNGMWADQANGYDNFVEWVNSYNPDVCIWVEAMTVYADNSSTAASTAKLSYTISTGSAWHTLAARYGHQYLAVAHRDDDNYPQIVTSRYPLKTLKTFGRIIFADDIYHGAGLHELDVDGTKVNIVTLHLKPNLDGNDNSNYRKYELEYVIKRTLLASGYASDNYIVAGDFNARTPLDAAYYSGASDTEYSPHRYLAENTDLIDVIGEKYPNRFMTTTLGSRIDFVYLTGSLYSKMTDAAVISDTWVDPNLPVSEYVASFRTPSDHRPIMLDIRLK